MSNYQAPTVRKAFQILRDITGSSTGRSISELSRGLGISKSTVHGILSALEAEGAIVRDPDSKRYKPGLTLLELGHLSGSTLILRDVARPHIEALMAKTGESVFFGTRSGQDVMILDSVESGHDLKIISAAGTRLPLLAGATGKAFLSMMTDDQAGEIIQEQGLRRYTDKTVTDPAQLLEQVRRVRETGYATDDEEYITGVRAVAAPIAGNGMMPSAVWVVGFAPNLTSEKMTYAAAAAKSAAVAIHQGAVDRFTGPGREIQ